ncbi:MAG: DEAD/DEAH box helicase [Phycisphaerales bacterium]
MKFNQLGLREHIVRAVADKGYEIPSPIQAQSIPVTMQGHDVFGCAQTGTGKTCAFALPILHRLSDPNNKPHRSRRNGHAGRSPRALVLCPTRELAMQIFESFVSYGKHLKQLRHAVVFGGVSQGKQVRAIRDGVDVLIATPGRLLDLINQGHIDLSQIEVLVLDEADRMLDMGFIGDIRKVVGMVREDRQTLFFSATVSREIRTLADSILTNPQRIETAQESTTVEAIAQCIYFVEKLSKPDLLEGLLLDPEVSRALVFSKTKYGADKLVKRLRKSHIDAEAIHGDKTQNARTRAMRRFKSGSTKVLIATDIASRGIDVNNISHVINYDMPLDPETYVHRIGRTARAGAKGIAISMCSSEEIGLYRQVERRAKIRIPFGEGFEDITFDAPPQERPQRKQRTRGRKAYGQRMFEQSQKPSKKRTPRGGKPHRKGTSNAENTRGDERGFEVKTTPATPRPKKSKPKASKPKASAPSEYKPKKKGKRTPSAESTRSTTRPNARSGSKKASKRSSANPKPKKGNGYPKGRRVGGGVKSIAKKPKKQSAR